MIRAWPVSRASSPIAASTRCTWPVFIAGDQVDRGLGPISPQTIPSRVLEDECDGEFPHGRRNGRTALDIIGGHRPAARVRHPGLWGNRRAALGASEQPNQVFYTPVGGRTQIMEKGEAGAGSDEAARLSRVAIAHPEGFPLAVANIYVDLAARDPGGRAGRSARRRKDGVRSMAAVLLPLSPRPRPMAAWTDARPHRCSARSRRVTGGGAVSPARSRGHGKSRVSGDSGSAASIVPTTEVDRGLDDLGDGRVAEWWSGRCSASPAISMSFSPDEARLSPGNAQARLLPPR